MKNLGRTTYMVALLFVAVSVAAGIPAGIPADNPIDFSGKWALENSEQNFYPNSPGRSLGPASGPVGGGNSDVRTGGEGSYRGGEGAVPKSLDSSSAPDLILSIVQNVTEIKFERTWTRDDGQPLISRESFTLDGEDKVVRNSEGKVESKSKTKWHKKELRIESTHYVSTGRRTVKVRVRQELSLSEDGQMLNLKTTQEIPTGRIIIKQTFKVKT